MEHRTALTRSVTKIWLWGVCGEPGFRVQRRAAGSGKRNDKKILSSLVEAGWASPVDGEKEDGRRRDRRAEPASDSGRPKPKPQLFSELSISMKREASAER
jgi:hypothetical protein